MSSRNLGIVAVVAVVMLVVSVVLYSTPRETVPLNNA